MTPIHFRAEAPGQPLTYEARPVSAARAHGHVELAPAPEVPHFGLTPDQRSAAMLKLSGLQAAFAAQGRSDFAEFYSEQRNRLNLLA